MAQDASLKAERIIFELEVNEEIIEPFQYLL